MFYSRREMEERDKGHSAAAALEIAAATSGRAVLISGLTVMTAMAGHAVRRQPDLRLLRRRHDPRRRRRDARLDDLPARDALLPRQKGWTEKGRVPWVAKRRHEAKGESRVWSADPHPRPQAPARLGDARRRPARRALRSPRSACSSRTRASTATRAASRSSRPTTASRPPSPAAPSRAMTVIKADDVTAAPVQAAIEQLHDQAIATGQLSEPSGVDISPDKTVAVVASRSRASAPTPRPTARSRSCATRSSRPPSASSPTPRSP